MPTDLNIVIAQLNPIVGDIAGNEAMVINTCAAQNDADLIIFSELFLSGYPPEDLIFRPAFMDAIEASTKRIIKATENYACGIVLPLPLRANKAPAHADIPHSEQIHSAAHLIHQGRIVHSACKHKLATYGVFDEDRHFTPGPMPDVFTFKDTRIALPICEDFWHPDISAHLAMQNPDIVIVPNGSPYHIGKHALRLARAQAFVEKVNAPLIYVNQVGGQDELVFDGGSFVMDAAGKIASQLPFFDTEVGTSLSGEPMEESEEIYAALTLGLRDYVRKNNFPGVIIGLSGGVDSALTAALAVDALGADNVHCVMMPTRFTSEDSLKDARECAEMLGVSYEIKEIAAPMEAFEATLPGLEGTAHENIQSRIRGLILMALSNSSGKMVLSTGNKSEMAVGYATLYGDMCGGYNALKDVYKTQVYELCHWRNTVNQVIPNSILTKAPTAELRDNQTDQDSLPEYDVLDAILEALIEGEKSAADIIAMGHDEVDVRKVQKLLYMAEYKRRQAPPGAKITRRAFGRERRYPITNGFV